MSPTCFFCGEPVNPASRSVWRRVKGWERKAPSGSTRAGGSDISMREPTGEFACDICIVRLKSGVSPDQISLL